MSRILRLLVRPALLLAVPLTFLAAGRAGAADLVSHRAAYTYFLGKAQTRIGGSVEENRVECDAWVQSSSHRMQGGNLLASRQQMRSRESRDGRALTFMHRISFVGRPYTTYEGRARRSGRDAPGTARLTSPEPKEVRLPPGTEFSAAYYLRMTRALHAGATTTLPRAPVFGILSKGPQLYYVEARRLDKGDPLFIRVEGDAHLLDTPAIDVALSLFPSRAAKSPLHRIILKLHDNGVYSRAVYVLPRMTITVEISSIEALPKAKC